MRLLGVLVATTGLITLPASGMAQRSGTSLYATEATLASGRPPLGSSLGSIPVWGANALRVGGSLPARVSWSASDIVLAGAFTTTLLLDAGQTRGLARGGWEGYSEANPLLGPHPSVGRINVYTAVAGLTVLGVAAAVPARARPWVLGAALAVEALTVARNAREGIAITFP